MKMKNALKYIALAAVLAMGASSCEKFLDRPAEDNYNSQNFYQDASQCIQGVNYLYNSPWYDAIRGFYRVGECFAGNYYMGDKNPYMQFTVNGSNDELRDMSYSLWGVNAHATTVYNRLKQTTGVDKQVIDMCEGEALTWKAFAYFFLVRSFGDVPIIHDMNSLIANNSYNSVPKAPKEDVYKYIVMTLEKALTLLPKKVANKDGRIDYYSAEALLAKVYLQKAGVTGTLNQEDLDKAAFYAKDVIENSGRELLEVYSDNFRMQNNKNLEALISWQWDASCQPWTTQNSFQCDIAPKGFDEFGDTWGQWAGPTIALQDQFNVSALENPADRHDIDTRRKATMLLPGDVCDYLWTTNGGFDYLRFFYDENYGPSGGSNASEGTLNSPTGAMCVKFLYGDGEDHKAALGVSAGRMANGLATHVLRLADVYLVYCEAKLHGPGSTTTDAFALECFNAVRRRAIPSWTDKTSISFEEVFRERNLELALEGDRWYDYVRVGYYNPDFAVNDILNQRRNAWSKSLDDACKAYYKGGAWDTSDIEYNEDEFIPTAAAIKAKLESLPFPSEDVVYNKKLDQEAEPFDFSTIEF